MGVDDEALKDLGFREADIKKTVVLLEERRSADVAVETLVREALLLLT